MSIDVYLSVLKAAPMEKEQEWLTEPFAVEYLTWCSGDSATMKDPTACACASALRLFLLLGLPPSSAHTTLEAGNEAPSAER